MATRDRRAPAHPRLVHLDNLKALMVAWVIGGHALLGYSATGGWAYDEINEVSFSPGVELVLGAGLGTSGLFVIGAFFFVSGLSVPRALARRGTGRFIRDRMLRLGVPFLASALLVWPAAVWLAYRAAGSHASYWWVFAHRDPLLDSGALWFAEVLLLYSVAYAVGHHISRAAEGRRPPRRLRGRHLVAVAIGLAVTTFLVRLWLPARGGQIGDLHLWQWPQCVAMFGLGTAAGRRGWAERVPGRVWRGSGLIAVATLGLVPALALLLGVADLAEGLRPFLGGWRWQALGAAAAEAALVVSGSVWLLGAAQHWAGRRGPWRMAWARAAYVAFVVQGPVLLMLSVAARSFDAPAEIKAPLVAVAGIAVCFGLGYLVTGRKAATQVTPDGR